MQGTTLPHWLYTSIIIGREGEDDPYERDENNEILMEDDEQVLKEGWELGTDGKPVKVADPDGSEEEGEENAEADALRESLKKERKLRRTAEREARKAQKNSATKEEKEDSEALTKKLEAQEAKTVKLAARFRTSAVDSAILEAARAAGFIDPTDALLDDVRKDVDVDQDEEDPSDIDIDEDSVVDAVKKLANKKKHLIGTPGGTAPSGGKFVKGKKIDPDKVTDESLKETYPSLR